MYLYNCLVRLTGRTWSFQDARIYCMQVYFCLSDISVRITCSRKLKETTTMPAAPVSFGSVEQLFKMVLDNVVKSHLRESLLTLRLI